MEDRNSTPAKTSGDKPGEKEFEGRPLKSEERNVSEQEIAITVPVREVEKKARLEEEEKGEEKKLKAEVQRLVDWGVLRKVNRSEWAMPAFTISKPDGTLRSLSDSRELNKRIKRMPYPLPRIQDILRRLQGFQWATALDLNMGYYHIL